MKGNGKIAEVFAKNVFSDAEMKKRLPEEIYSDWSKKKTDADAPVCFIICFNKYSQY